MITFSNLGQMGQLGNQLFQIASTIGTAKKNNTDFVFPHWSYENVFNLHNCFSNNIKIDNLYKESGFEYINPVVNNQGVTDLYGFFQSHKYFEHCESYIKFVFESVYQEKLPPNITSLHVRRKDYATLGNSYYITLGNTDYYERAMDIVKSNNYYVFSDDIEWCKGRFKGNEFTFIDEPDPCKSMALMSGCTNNIIANSSFSWWAAYLNKTPNKTIIAPNNWFGPSLPHNTKDLIPAAWRKI